MISACVNCRDDEATVSRWVECVIDHVSEIIICDTGSQDRTKEIILDYRLKKLKLVEKPWPEFLQARNWFFEVASQPYILQLDADEVVLNSFWDKLPQYIHRLATEYDSIRLPHYNAQFKFTDFETLYRKARNFDEKVCSLQLPEGCSLSSRFEHKKIQWKSFHRGSEIFNNLSTTRCFVDFKPLIHCYPANHKMFNDEYRARKILSYSKLIPGYWENSWTAFLKARFSAEKLDQMKTEILSANDLAPHSSWWSKVGRFQ
jgi:glycosyltransferase involved in cell wall biosynthesis